VPRPERIIDPAEGPVGEFAAALRQERDRAGRPTYRQMARTAHRSQTSLSEAAGGRVLPTWETTEAFLRACGVTELESWRRRWEHSRGDDPIAGPVPSGRRQQTRPVLIGVLALVVGVAGLIVLSGQDGEQEAVRSTVSAGADPEETGCANDNDASTVDAREVLLDDLPIGVVELRYSPRCAASWPRFTPADPRYATIAKPGPIQVRLTVTADDEQRTSASFTVRYVGLPVFGNLIDSSTACVRAEVVVYGPGWRSEVGRTGCFRGESAVR
jgi:hypothetical protein